MAHLLRNPEECLLPEDERPPEPPRARIWADKGEWVKVCQHALRIGLFSPLREAEVFHKRGKPVLNGAFAIGSDQTVDGRPDLQLQRLIMQEMPSNAYQRPLLLDMRHLADGLNWARLPPLEEEQGWLQSEEDQVCCVYLHLLPKAWWPYHAFACPLSVEQIREVMDWPHNEPAYMASVAPAMG